MNAKTVMENDAKYIAHTYARNPLVLEKGKNATAWDADGKKYIDFTSGIGVNALGWANEGWVEAVTKQLSTLQHTSNVFYSEPCTIAAKMICEKSGMKKVFFANSGAEANEGVIKAARKYSFTKYGPQRRTIVALENSFHGRTMATLSATGQDVFHQYFFPFVEDFKFAKANDTEGTIAMLTGEVCAVMMEMVQGEGGVMPLDKEYVKAVYDYCQAHDILLIVDEVQTGIGRSGTFFSYQQFDIQPDLVSCAKGLGGGLPIGAVLFGEKTEDVFGPSDHGSTFGGNPAVCAGAVYVMNQIDDAFMVEVAKKGIYMREKISKMAHVKSVVGMGMMLGVELEEGYTSKQVLSALLQNGLMVLTAKAKVRLLPPLTITQEELDEGLEIMEQTLANM